MLFFAIALHVLSAVIWVGGMFFAYMVLRPVAASQLEPPARLRLWRGNFARFFPWVWVSVILLLVTGYWMMFSRFGGMHAPMYIQIMQVLGIIMMLIFLHLFFAPYRRFRKAVDAENIQIAVPQLDKIRKFIAINLTVGLLVIITATAGRYLTGF